jgi:prolyl 4-hydroxylase
MTDSKMNGGGVAPSVSSAHADATRNALSSAAIAGDLSAKLELGAALLAAPKDPRDMLEGVAVTVSAANDGDGGAAYRTAVFSAAGISMPSNWPTALVYLQRSAELGYEPAREEMAVLSADKKLAARALSGDERSADVWRRLRESVDLNALRRTPNAKALALNPRMAMIEKFLSPGLCDALIAKAKDRLLPINVPEGRESSADKAGYHRLGVSELSLEIALTLDRVGEAISQPSRAAEPPIILRYAGDEDFPAHADFLDPRDPANAENIRREGQRVISFFVFLNDNYEGGETEFPRIEKRIKGKKGDALFWWNVKPDATPDADAVNGNCPVTSGEKWLLAQWIRSPIPRPR